MTKGRKTRRNKGRKLEEFRSFRTSKRRTKDKRRNKEVRKERMLKLRIVLYVTKTQMGNKSTKSQLKLKEIL